MPAEVDPAGQVGRHVEAVEGERDKRLELCGTSLMARKFESLQVHRQHWRQFGDGSLFDGPGG